MPTGLLRRNAGPGWFTASGVQRYNVGDTICFR